MPKINLPIVGGAYKDTHTAIACQTCVNMYAEPTQDGVKSQGALLSAKSMKTLHSAQEHCSRRDVRMKTPSR